MNRLPLPFALATLLAATPALAHDKLPASLARLAPTDFARTATVVDDPNGPATVISTQGGYTRTRALEGALADDVHLRASIDRGTGAVTWQVWHDLAYVGARKEVNAVLYTANGTQRDARPFRVEHRPDRCPPTDAPGHCGEAVTIGFELSEATLREIAGGYAPGSRSPWRVQFKSADGSDVTGGLAPAEAAGILLAVDSWRRARGEAL